MKKILLILAAGCTMALVSCEEWLDKYPLAQMSPETFFSNENELQAFSNKFYTAFPSDGLYNEYWDNIIHNDLPQEMRGGRTIPASGGGWTWTSLRDINTLLEYSVNCKDLDVRNRYDALARFFRAYFYFEKIKRFGDVPWYSKPIGSADPELKRPRDSREYVMQRMIEDIDFAIRYLPTKHDLYRITKWTALALKSRFCLLEGTFRKYHGIDLPENDWKYYLDLSAKASEEFITNSGYGLYTSGGTQTAYRDLFVSEDAQQIEVVLARDYNKGLSVFHNSTFYSLNTSYGRPGLTRKIVASYLMADGTRFTDKAGWETMEFRDECQNRDPRLAQSIRTPGYTRINSTKVEVPKNELITEESVLALIRSTGVKTSLSRTFIRSRMVRAMRTKPTENWLESCSPTVRTRRFERWSISSTSAFELMSWIRYLMMAMMSSRVSVRIAGSMSKSSFLLIR